LTNLLWRDWYVKTFSDHIYEIVEYDSKNLTRTKNTLSFFQIFLCYTGFINSEDAKIQYNSCKSDSNRFYEIKYCDGTSFLTKTFEIDEHTKTNVIKVDKYIFAGLMDHNIVYFINKYYNTLVKEQFTVDEIFVYFFFEKSWSMYQLGKALLNRSQIEIYVIKNNDMFEEDLVKVKFD
jgi:hypothetical protein